MKNRDQCKKTERNKIEEIRYRMREIFQTHCRILCGGKLLINWKDGRKTF
jgi:hypothetical protein